MQIGVFVKPVPDTGPDTRVVDSGGSATIQVGKWITNPYDELALESAIRLKEAGAADKVVTFTVGAKNHDKLIRNGLAAGADEAVRLDDPAFADSDALGIARILAAAAKKAGVGMIIAGKESTDGGASAVPSMVAELLGWNQVTIVNELSVDGGTLSASRVMGGGSVDEVSAALPAVVTAEKGLPPLRFTKLQAIMKAKKKPLNVWGAGDLGLDASQVGAGAAVVNEGSLAAPPARQGGKIIGGSSVQAQVTELVGLLRNEAKVI